MMGAKPSGGKEDTKYLLNRVDSKQASFIIVLRCDNYWVAIGTYLLKAPDYKTQLCVRFVDVMFNSILLTYAEYL